MGDFSKSSEFDNKKLLYGINQKNQKVNYSNQFNRHNLNKQFESNNNIEIQNNIEENITNNYLDDEKNNEYDSKLQFSISKSILSGYKENKRYLNQKDENEKIEEEMEKDIFQIPSKKNDINNLIQNNNNNFINNNNNYKNSNNYNNTNTKITFNNENINLNNNNNSKNFPKIKNPFDSINENNLKSVEQSIFSDNKNFAQSLNELPKKKGTFENNLLKSSFMRRSAAQSQKVKKKDNLTSYASSKIEQNSISNLEYSQSQNNDINSRDVSLKFDIIENEEANYNKHYKRNNNLQNIIESDEENEDDDTLRKLNLDDIVIFVKKFNDGNYNLNYINNQYELNKKICEIINNNPFQNISFKILSNSNNFSNFFNMTNEQLIEKIDKEFYDNLESINKFEQIIKKYHHKEFKHYYSLCVSEVYPINYQELKSYRTVLCDDGNGFLRAFIFNLFEVFIINKNIRELRKITYEISTKISTEFEYNNIVVEKNELIIIMKIIITHLENSNIGDALLVFTNAFLYHSSFEFGLIKFIRIALGNFIFNNKDIFNLGNLKELIPFKYIDKKIFKYNLYINERVMIMDYEIDSFIFFILPHIFNINLKLFYDNNSIILNCNTPEKNNGTIKIIYDFSYYKIGYDTNFITNNSKFIPYISREQNEKCNIIIINNNLNQICEICKEKPNEFIKVHKIYEQICKKCLIKYIKEALKKRLKFFMEDYYLHEEYYCSDLQFTNSLEYNLFISNSDIKQLFNVVNGIPTIIRGNIKKIIMCFLCNEKFEKKTAFILNCSCIFCKECIQNLILEKTNGKIILNEYEKKKEKIIINCPKCNNNISNYNNLIKKLFDIEKYKNEAEERLKNQIQIQCCVCSSNDVNFSFDLLVNKINVTHSLCKKCKFNLDERLKIDQKRSYQTQFNCLFCNEQHFYNMINFNEVNHNNNNKDKDQNKCCSIF